jgi:enamine deaminase RidA (YjgF/YER057c/UK114 family)
MKTTIQEQARQSFDNALAALETAAAALANAQNVESTLEDMRALVKEEATLRLMQSENPLTSKAHSASSAKDIVERDAEYFAHRKRQRDAVVATQRAWATWEAAKRTAEAATAQLSALLRDNPVMPDGDLAVIVADYEIVET